MVIRWYYQRTEEVKTLFEILQKGEKSYGTEKVKPVYEIRLGFLYSW